MKSFEPSLSKSLINKIYYFGFRYRCPFCDSHLRTFFPTGRKIDQTIEDASITDPLERIHTYDSPDHVRLYSKKDYIKRLEQTGFTVIDFRWQKKKYSGFPNNKFGLNENESLFYAKKQ